MRDSFSAGRTGDASVSLIEREELILITTHFPIHRMQMNGVIFFARQGFDDNDALLTSEGRRYRGRLICLGPRGATA